jgi:sodium/hydrogen antiporter
MGVGAIFISSLALDKLPTPHNPPENQTELLATVLQPIISFVVLGSIIIRKHHQLHLQLHNLSLSLDGLSIPFFSFGKRVHSRTVSITQTWTARSGNQDPDWMTSVRRISSPGSLVSDPTSIANPASAVHSSSVEMPGSAHVIIEVPKVDGATAAIRRAAPPPPPLQLPSSTPTAASSTIEVQGIASEVVVQQRTVRFPNRIPLPPSPLPSSSEWPGSRSATPNGGGEGDSEVVQSRTVHFPASPMVEDEDRGGGALVVQKTVRFPIEQ